MNNNGKIFLKSIAKLQKISLKKYSAALVIQAECRSNEIER